MHNPGLFPILEETPDDLKSEKGSLIARLGYAYNRIDNPSAYSDMSPDQYCFELAADAYKALENLGYYDSKIYNVAARALILASNYLQFIGPQRPPIYLQEVESLRTDLGKLKIKLLGLETENLQTSTCCTIL